MAHCLCLTQTTSELVRPQQARRTSLTRDVQDDPARLVQLADVDGSPFYGRVVVMVVRILDVHMCILPGVETRGGLYKRSYHYCCCRHPDEMTDVSAIVTGL